MGKFLGLLALLVALAFFSGMSIAELGSVIGAVIGGILTFIANVANGLAGR